MTGCLDDSLAAQSVAPESKLKAEAFTDIWSVQIENIPSSLHLQNKNLYKYILFSLKYDLNKSTSQGNYFCKHSYKSEVLTHKHGPVA